MHLNDLFNHLNDFTWQKLFYQQNIPSVTKNISWRQGCRFAFDIGGDINQQHQHQRAGCLKGIVQQKNENSVIYSPSSSSKPVWMCLFCRTQRKIFWETEQFWGTIDFYSIFFSYCGSQWCPKTAWLQTFFKICSFVFSRTKIFIQIWNYIFGKTIPLITHHFIWILI